MCAQLTSYTAIYRKSLSQSNTKITQNIKYSMKQKSQSISSKSNLALSSYHKEMSFHTVKHAPHRSNSVTCLGQALLLYTLG